MTRLHLFVAIKMIIPLTISFFVFWWAAISIEIINRPLPPIKPLNTRALHEIDSLLLQLNQTRLELHEQRQAE
jgi:hypothetical protein